MQDITFIIVVLLGLGAAFIATQLIFFFIGRLFTGGGRIAIAFSKIGFYRTIHAYFLKLSERSRKVIILFARLCLIPCLLLLGAVNLYSDYFVIRPNLSFQYIVGVHQPSDVHILQMEATGSFDLVYWIHFTTTPERLLEIVRDGNYHYERTDSAKQIVDVHLLAPPRWWILPPQSRDWREYHCDPRFPSANSDNNRTLVVSHDGTDVFAFWIPSDD